jgi:limonene-1,2-epoxide hydrolase
VISYPDYDEWRIDAAIADSLPASDPPPWTLGIEPTEQSRPVTPLAIVARFIACVNRGDLEGIGQLIAPAHRLEVFDEPPVVGKDAIIEAWRGYLKSFPNDSIHPARLAANGSTVSVLGSTTGSHWQLPDQEELRLTLIWVATVEDSRLVSWQLVEDSSDRRKQLALDL